MTESQIHQPGDTIAGRYTLLEEIGRGGFGVVFRAVQRGVNRHVALKILSPSHTREGFDFGKSFHNEALHTSRLSHPNTITLFDYGETPEGHLYLVTELLHGETLRQRLKRDRILSPRVAVHIARQISKSLAEAHSLGIIHGDLKPENIFLLDLHGEEDFVKLLDFGIARLVGEARQTLMGTPEYLAPEHFLGSEITPAADIYSAALILYEMLVGRSPYSGKRFDGLYRGHVIEPLPPLPTRLAQSTLGELLRSATRKEAGDRPADGLALLEALNSLGPLQQTLDALRRAQVVVPGLTTQEIPQLQRVSQSDEATTGEIHGNDFLDGESDLWRPPSLGASQALFVAPHRLPLVGHRKTRERLLGAVHRAFDQARGVVILIGGVLGLGRTRLAQWLVEEAELPPNILSGADAYHPNAPYALAEALTDALGVDRAAEPALAAEALRGCLEALARSDTPPTGPPAQDDALDGLRALCGAAPCTDKALRAAAALIVEAAAHTPMLLCLDDLQHAGEIARAGIAHLADLIDRVPCRLALACTVQRDTLGLDAPFSAWLVEMRLRHPCISPVSLERLAQEEAEALARLALGAELGDSFGHGAISVGLVSAIARASQGNPRYIAALSRALRDQDLLTNTIDGVGLRQDAELPLPAELIAPICAPVIALCKNHPFGQELEALLQLCAVLGQIIPRGILIRAFEQSGQAAEVLDDLLGALLRADLLTQHRAEGHAWRAGLSYTFTQPLLIPVLEHQLALLGDLDALHRRAALIKQAFYSASGTLHDHLDEIDAHYERISVDEDLNWGDE